MWQTPLARDQSSYFSIRLSVFAEVYLLETKETKDVPKPSLLVCQCLATCTVSPFIVPHNDERLLIAAPNSISSSRDFPRGLPSEGSGVPVLLSRSVGSDDRWCVLGCDDNLLRKRNKKGIGDIRSK